MHTRISFLQFSTMIAAAALLMVLNVGCGGSGKAPTGKSPKDTPAPNAQADPAPRGHPAPAASGNARMRGVRVVAAAAPGEGDEMRAFNWFPGTAVSIYLPMPAGGIIACDHHKSTLDVFKDDKGTDMLNAPKIGKFSQSGLEMMPKIAPGGKGLLFEAKAASLPAKDATSLTVSGKLHLQLATKKMTVRAEDIALTKGAKFKLGDWEMEVKETGKPQWGGGDYQFNVTFHLKQDMAALAEMRFRDANGQLIEAQKGGGMRSSFGNQVSVDTSYLFKAKIAKVTLEADVWSDMREEVVPFEASGGLGL